MPQLNIDRFWIPAKNKVCLCEINVIFVVVVVGNPTRFLPYTHTHGRKEKRGGRGHTITAEILVGRKKGFFFGRGEGPWDWEAIKTFPSFLLGVTAGKQLVPTY